MTTRIFSRSDKNKGYEIDTPEFVLFPELSSFCEEPSPLLPKDEIKLCPDLVGKTFITLSEYIILWFLREIADGRMKPDDVELYCDGKRIRIDTDGELIDRWPGGFYRERSALLFGKA